MDLNFEQMLAKHNQEYKEAEVYSTWMPDDGEYIVSLIKLDEGTSTKDGVNMVWWKLTGRIEDVQDEKLNGREFTVGYYTSKVFGILKGAVKTLAGDIINDLAEAHAVLEASIGKIIRAKVDTTTSKKNGKEYTNCYIMEVIDTTTIQEGLETLEAETPATVVPDGIYTIPPTEEVPTTPLEVPPIV